MREIKFRGKVLKSSDWAYGDLHILSDMPHIHTATSVFPYMGKAQFVDINTIGQFTGLLDKNGKEIYEKDIIKDHVTNQIGYINWLPQECGFVIVWKKSDSRLGHRNRGGYRTDPSLEVIGNVYDNPELLEGGTK